MSIPPVHNELLLFDRARKNTYRLISNWPTNNGSQSWKIQNYVIQLRRTENKTLQRVLQDDQESLL
jgi:hypothetical protein